MTAANTIMLIVGAIIIIFGIAAFIHPNIARWISVPGGPKTKGIIAMMVGIILIIISLSIWDGGY